MSWFWRTKQPTANMCLGIELRPEGYIAVLRHAEGVVAAGQYQSHQAELQDCLQHLIGWLQQQTTGVVAVTVSLCPQDFELHLVEAPDVPDEELSDALSFRITELVSRPLDTQVIEAFRVPPDAYRGRMDMAFVAVVERQRIQQVVDWCDEYALMLHNITIPQISLLNLLCYLEPENSVGVLRLNEMEGEINLYQDGALYLARRVGIGTSELELQTAVNHSGSNTGLETDSYLEKLVLEIQRSLDYYESQLGMGTVGQLWLLVAGDLDMHHLLPELERSINVPVRTLPVDGVHNQLSSSEMLAPSHAIAIGGSLSYALAG